MAARVNSSNKMVNTSYRVEWLSTKFLAMSAVRLVCTYIHVHSLIAGKLGNAGYKIARNLMTGCFSSQPNHSLLIQPPPGISSPISLRLRRRKGTTKRRGICICRREDQEARSSSDNTDMYIICIFCSSQPYNPIQFIRSNHIRKNQSSPDVWEISW